MLLRRGIATRHAAATAVVPRRLSLHLRHLCALPNRVQAETESLHEKVLAPLNSRLRGPLERRPFTSGVPLPIVLLLGNHSSGKSSFINYVLGRDVQTTGVAPTDDGFTVIAPGTEDVDRDGASFIGDPTLGFAPLRTFGPAFMNHFTLKVRTGLATDSMLLVDSPGMIDAPAALGGRERPSGVNAGDRSTAERGYDFLRVTRWLAEHSDVVLLFFDPDKPGTTGETLECLTTSLSGMEHKLLIVMNKVDQFVHIHDFARAYGSLCWNLSKVIPRKDLPRIYTMFLPPSARSSVDRAAASTHAKVPAETGTQSAAASSLSHALAELSATRDEVLHAVKSAPERRVDNLITRAHDACALLRTHAVVLEEARRQYTSLRLKYVGLVGSLVASAPAAGYLAWWQFDVATHYCGGIGGAIVAAAALAAVHGQGALQATRQRLLSESGLDEIFEELHAVEVSERDEYIISLWARAKPAVQSAISTLALNELDGLSTKELEQLDEILKDTVPELRRLTSHSSSAP